MRTVKQRWKLFALAVFVAAGLGVSTDVMAAASKKNVICVKTSTGNYYPVVTVSQLVAVNGGTTFNIVLKDGKKENGIESISFEKHEVEIDFSEYQTNSDGTPYVDMTKPVYMVTSTGKLILMKDLPTMEVQEGSTKFDVKVNGSIEGNLTHVSFYRGNPEDFNKSEDNTGDANGDGNVNAADIVEVVNYIMGSPSGGFNNTNADANGDGTVNAADIVYMVNIIMNKK
jgi:hypothetical protein